MIQLKSARDIECLAEGGEILAGILERIIQAVKPGSVPSELDKLARDLITEANCRPSFLYYAPNGHSPFPAALCVSVNQGVVHGMPNSVPLKSGDVVGFDLGLIYQKKYYLDHARTVGVGDVSADAQKLMNVTNEALRLGVEQAKIGNYTGNIGAAVHDYVEGQGFEVVKQLVGHGVGFGVHEDPRVPNFGNFGEGDLLEEGLVIAIEPMVSIGDANVKTGGDGWTVEVKGGGISAHSEHTVAVTKAGPRVLTINSL